MTCGDEGGGGGFGTTALTNGIITAGAMDGQTGKIVDHNEMPHRIPAQPQILHLKVLSAQQLPRPRASTAKGDTGLDPFVVLEVFGVPADCAEERTKTVRNDSFNPTFDESFQFTISVPELVDWKICI
jgi:hypothetical protein